MEHQFITYISKYIHLEDAEINAIKKKIPLQRYQAGDHLLKEGSISRISYFNIQGCVRLYHLINGEERTTFFYTENSFITSMRSFSKKVPAPHYLECTEDSTLAVIPYEVEQQLIHDFPNLAVFARMSLEEELANYQEMLSQYITSSPEQRYLKLIQDRPGLLQRTKLHHLASFIGVKPESLSRIRKRISKKIS